MSMASRAILSNFFEEQWTQNHPQYLSGLSRALFPTTFLETALSLTKLIWRYFNKHVCSGANFQYIFLLFDVFIVNTGALKKDNLFFWRRRVSYLP